MGSGYLLNPVIFLVETIFGLYILIVMLRFLLQLTRADFYNPISQFIVKLTNAPLKPLRRVIPGWGGIDNASIVLLFLLQLFALAILLFFAGVKPDISILPGLLVGTITKLISLLFYVYIFGIFIMAIISWISPGSYNPVGALLASLTEPLMRPVRKVIPPVGGVDLSPMVALIGLYIVRMLVMPPLQLATVKAGFPLGAVGLL